MVFATVLLYHAGENEMRKPRVRKKKNVSNPDRNYREYICFYCGTTEKHYSLSEGLLIEKCPKRSNGDLHFWVRRDQVCRECWNELQKSGQEMDAESMFLIAHTCETSYHPKDNELAVLWHEKAAKLGHAKSMIALAKIYQKGKGVPKDMEKTALWYKRAADSGNIEAMATLGIRYESGIDLPQDTEEAIIWYRKAAELGHMNSMISLANIYHRGQGIPKNIKEAAKWYKKAAFSGDVNSMLYLGCIYEEGDGITQDIVEAERWYRKASDAGEHLGKLGLGRIYELKNERAIAMGIYEELAKEVTSPPSFWIDNLLASHRQPHGQAAETQDHRTLGGSPLFPFPIILFPTAPVGWNFSKITDVMSQTNESDPADLARRGYAYEQGIAGVEKDLGKAIEWYQKAADAGNKYAMFALGNLYSKGMGNVDDMEKAFAYFRKAAMAGCQSKCGRRKWKTFLSAGEKSI